MTKFIKLTTKIINSNRITEIIKKDYKYEIYMTTIHSSGFMTLFGGFFDTKQDYHEICQKKNPVDYNTITNWIDKLDD